jgi:hypothetical protein
MVILKFGYNEKISHLPKIKWARLHYSYQSVIWWAYWILDQNEKIKLFEITSEKVLVKLIEWFLRNILKHHLLIDNKSQAMDNVHIRKK